MNLLNYSHIQVALALLLLFILPFLNLFPGALDLSQPLNYIALSASILILFVGFQSKTSKHILIVCTTLIIILISNFSLAPYASVKWLVNWIGFIIIFFVWASVFKTFNAKALSLLDDAALSLLSISIITNAVLSLWVLASGKITYEYIVNPALFNQSMSVYGSLVGFEKQNLGYILALQFSGLWHFRSRMSNRLLVVLLASIIPVIPAAISVRSLLAASSLFLMLCVSYRIRLNILIKISALLIFLMASALIFDYNSVSAAYSNLYDRHNSVSFALDVASRHLMGIGNGAYSIYVAKNNSSILSSHGSMQMIKEGAFWGAPESDISYYIASWGILSIFFFIFSSWLIYCCIRLVSSRAKSLFAVERLIMTTASLLLLMGIFQDIAGSLIWWTFTSAALGICLRTMARPPGFQIHPQTFPKIRKPTNTPLW